MIPSILHRIWLDDPMPPVFAEYGRQWQALHPTWEWWQLTDSKLLPDVLPGWRNPYLYDTAKQRFPGDWKRYRADLLRLELLYEYGGVYVDTDIEPHRNLEPLLDDHSVVMGRSPQHIGGVHPITNAFIAAEPRHPFIEACLDALPGSVAQSSQFLAGVAGPWLMTRVYESQKWPTVHIEPWLYEAGWFTHKWNNARRARGEGLDQVQSQP